MRIVGHIKSLSDKKVRKYREISYGKNSEISPKSYNRKFRKMFDGDCCTSIADMENSILRCEKILQKISKNSAILNVRNFLIKILNSF